MTAAEHIAVPQPCRVAVQLLRADLPGTVMGAPQDWPRWAVLFPHVEAVVGHVAAADAVVDWSGDDGVAGAESWLLDRARHVRAGACPAGIRAVADGTRPSHRRGGARA
jgi:hypothetical protein